ncbi:MAG: peptidase M50 [Gammaproteobacteria bacterium]|nr:peptidase M50 [Gammaproteobacteria bacterium]
MAAQNDNWALIAELKPRLRSHIRIDPQCYRGQRWYVLRDSSNGRYMRFNASAYGFIGRLDGRLTVAEIHTALQQHSEDEEPLSREELSLLLAQLSTIGALVGDLPTDTKALFQRYQRERRNRMQNSFLNPLSLRFPLLDPDALLERLLPWVRPLFTRSGALIWLLVVGFAGLLALTNFQALTTEMDKDILRPANLVAMALLFILIKTLHEFSHAFAVKIWGGEVHEMGITLLVMAPVPYVDASAAWSFRAKQKRILVSAIGILSELFLAALALFVWLSVEPGLARDLAYNAMLIATVSTLLFNANPLLKFDGYHVLQDLVEIPNLYSRASRYYLYLIQRYLLGLDDLSSPANAPGERGWFLLYGLAAFCYRLTILVVIVLFLIEQYLVIGVALACWAVMMQLLLPLWRSLRFLAAAPTMAGRRLRGSGALTLGVSVLAAVLLYLPVALTTHAEGVVWMREQGSLFAGADGFVEELLAEPGQWVEQGQAVVRLREPELQSRIRVLQAKRRELEIQRAAQRISDRIASDIVEEELKRTESELQHLQRQSQALTIHATTSGRLVLPDAEGVLGRYMHQGELFGYLIDPSAVVVRAVVPQKDIGLLRNRVERVEIRLAERLHETLPSTLLRETPAGDTRLPSRALGATGGGDIAIRQSDGDGITAAEAVFHVDLALPSNGAINSVGQRAYVRFEHGSESLAAQWLRSGRQLLLSRLGL